MVIRIHASMAAHSHRTTATKSPAWLAPGGASSFRASVKVRQADLDRPSEAGLANVAVYLADPAAGFGLRASHQLRELVVRYRTPGQNESGEHRALRLGLRLPDRRLFD